MNDSEIIKALECCSDNDKGCEECPFDQIECITTEENTLLLATLALINRQKAEIERLTTMHSEMCIGMKRLKSEAYREFAERLCKDRVSNDPVVIAVKVELKELTEK